MRLRPLLGAATGFALTASLLIAPATSAAGTTRYVDDDGTAGAAGCNGSKNVHASIQGAIDDSADGDTILVCPGSYTENVAINGIDGLTLRAVDPWTAVIKNPVPDVPAGSSSAPFMVGIYDANDITVRGFKLIHHAYDTCVSGFAEIGILFVGAKDVAIRGNRIVGTGDTLSECGLAAGIMAGFPFGLTSAAAAAAPAGLPPDLTTTGLIAYNVVRDHAFMGIAAVSSPNLVAGAPSAPTKVDIRNNSVKYYHEGQPYDSCFVPGSSRQRASLRDTFGKLLPAGPGIPCFGIGIYQGPTTSDAPPPGVSGMVSRNRIMSGPNARPTIATTAGEEPAPTPAQLIGILVVDQKHASGASTLRKNILRRNTFGIMAVDASGLRVSANRVRETLFGISVFDTEGDVQVRDNRVMNSMVGIWTQDQPVDDTPEAWYVTSDLLIKGNDATGNGTSCEDDTTGTGTLGTANTWTGNDAEVNSSDPDGICGPTAP